MCSRFAIGAALLIGPTFAHAQVAEYASKQGWISATNASYSTIDFTGFPDGTPINNQYTDFGTTFQGLAFAFESIGFANDGWGIHGPGGLRISFDSPQNWIGIDHPGVARFQLFKDGALFYTSSLFLGSPTGIGGFSGLVSNETFDEVYIYKPPPFDNQVFIDDLHWGSSVPSPSALTVGVLGTLGISRRRRV